MHTGCSSVVKIGQVYIGGDFPVNIQSMTNTNTADVEATVQQILCLAKAGAAMVRLAVKSIREAELLSCIKEKMYAAGISIPLIADVHFNPDIAVLCASVVEKVRINPGNFFDKRSRKHRTYSEEEYAGELQKIRNRFIPFLEICKKNNTVIRIGANHGSLSERIVSRYGDTPEGMAESVMEFLRICRDQNFFNVVVSMKASNVRIMVYATRLIVQKMHDEGMNFPIHLGVTESGAGEEGRVRSSLGIGMLLIQGIGDTIRVSLTEDPMCELPVAKMICDAFARKTALIPLTDNHYAYVRYPSRRVYNIGGDNVPIVISTSKSGIADSGADFIFGYNEKISTIPIICPAAEWIADNRQISFPLFDANEFLCAEKLSPQLNFVNVTTTGDIHTIKARCEQNPNTVVVVATGTSIYALYDIVEALFSWRSTIPVVLRYISSCLDYEKLIVEASGILGFFLIDGFADGIWIDNPHFSMEKIERLSYNILQASRSRITKTEYISCPTCGRTQFDIQSVLQQIKERTSHLSGLKIAVMGCIVNGPGEMADADYGLVGAGQDKISLYKGQEIVKKNIGQQFAAEEMIALLKSDGKWQEPK